MKYNYQYFINRVLQIKHFIFVLEWIIKLRPKEVFDYGCARGPFVHAFNFFKIPCYGYDISKYSIKNPIGLAKGKISNSLPKKKFDTVICIDVMEHIPKEKEKKVIDDLIKLSNKWVLLSICDVSLKDKYYDSTHCNLETREYWIKKFEKRGLELHKKYLFIGSIKINYIYLKKRIK
jgi:hypothetical protein